MHDRPNNNLGLHYRPGKVYVKPLSTVV